MAASPLTNLFNNSSSNKIRWADMDDDDTDAQDGFQFISNQSFVSPPPSSRIGLPSSTPVSSPSSSINENTPPPSTPPTSSSLSNTKTGMVGFSSIIKQWSDVVAPRKDSFSSSFSSSMINNPPPTRTEIFDSDLDSSRDGLPLMLKKSSFPSTMQTIEENNSMTDEEWQKVTAGKKRNLGQNIGKQEQANNTASQQSIANAVPAGSLNTPPTMAKPQSRQPRIIKKNAMIIQTTNNNSPQTNSPASSASADRPLRTVSAPTGWTRQKSTELIREIKGEPSSSTPSQPPATPSNETPSTPNQGGKKKQKLNGGHYRNVTPASTPNNTPRAQRTHSGVWNNHNNNNNNNNSTKFSVRLLSDPVPMSLPETINTPSQRSGSISSDTMETPISAPRSLQLSDLSSASFSSAILAAAATMNASETKAATDGDSSSAADVTGDGDKSKVVPRVLTWEERLKQRQKQIDIGKRTAGYAHYLATVPKNRRQSGQPRTPNIHKQCSKRSWDGQVRKWRRQLHFYDPKTENGSENLFDESMDGGEGEGEGEGSGSEEYIDVENELKAMAEEAALDIQVAQVLEAENAQQQTPFLTHTVSSVHPNEMNLPDNNNDTPVLLRSATQ